MVVEKQIAFTQSWLAMGMEMLKLQQRLFWSWMSNPWTAGRQLPAMGQRVAALVGAARVLEQMEGSVL